MSVLPVHIEDITVTTNLNVNIPLDKVVNNEETAEYDDAVSKGVVCRIKEPKATAIIFSSGKIVCTGTKTMREAEDAISQFVEKIKELGAEVTEKPEMEIENIVAAFRLRESIDIEELAAKLEGAVYNADELPALAYRSGEHDADFLILGKKIICTGSRSIKDVQAAMKSLKEKLAKAGFKVEFV